MTHWLPAWTGLLSLQSLSVIITSFPVADMPASTSSSAAKGYESTLRRLEHLQSHLTRRPRSGRVSGYVCIVTGAGSPTGIARASVLHLAHEGAKHIYALDFDGSNFDDLKDKVKERYPDVKVTSMECDAADEESIKGIVERAMKEEGRLDVFFANAAIVGNPVPVGMLDAEDVAETMRVNVARWVRERSGGKA